MRYCHVSTKQWYNYKVNFDNGYGVVKRLPSRSISLYRIVHLYKKIQEKWLLRSRFDGWFGQNRNTTNCSNPLFGMHQTENHYHYYCQKNVNSSNKVSGGARSHVYMGHNSFIRDKNIHLCVLNLGTCGSIGEILTKLPQQQHVKWPYKFIFTNFTWVI